MTAMAPVEVYGLTVPAGSIAVEADGGVDYPATFRITMAAIDPTAEVDPEDPKLAVLKLIKVPAPDFGDDEDEDDEDEDDEEDSDEEEIDEDDVRAIEKRLGLIEGDDEDEEDSSDDDAGAGPSDPSKAKARAEAAILKALEEASDEDMDDSLMSNGVNGVKKNKGKARALDAMAEFEDADEDDEDLDDEEDEIKEYIICTLDPTKSCQQTLDITLNNENELCYFQVSGGYDVHLTGNFVIPPTADDDSEDDEEYDEEDPLGLDDLEELSDEIDSEEDELDDIDDPRIMEVDSDEEEAPALVKAAVAKGKNKRGAEDAGLDVLDKIIATEASTDKLSKKDKKKLKNNAGEAVAAAAAPSPADKKAAKAVPKDAVAQAAAAEKDTPTNGKKSVQFAKNLEQGPTPSKADAGKTAALGVKVVEGVTIDDKKLGTGKQVKKGVRVELRYIGKLTNGKQFDANKKGKPFSFKVGAGEVVKGFDIGVQGMQVGGERRITIPSKLGYGSKSPGKEIPANSDLIFDLKLLGIN